MSEWPSTTRSRIRLAVVVASAALRGRALDPDRLTPAERWLFLGIRAAPAEPDYDHEVEADEYGPHCCAEHAVAAFGESVTGHNGPHE